MYFNPRGTTGLFNSHGKEKKDRFKAVPEAADLRAKNVWRRRVRKSRASPLKDKDNRRPTPPLFPSPRLVFLGGRAGRGTRHRLERFRTSKSAKKVWPKSQREKERDRQRQREKKAPFPPHPHPFHQLHKQQNHRLSGWGWSICYCQCIALVVVRWVVSALFGGGGGGLRLLAIAFTMLMLRFSSANRTLDWRAGLDAYSTGAWGSVAYTFS